MDTANENLWRGTSSDERADERRDRLLAACREIVGREGGGGLSVRAVCRAAGVGPRYFYAGFPDVDTLLLATYEHAVGELLAAVASVAGGAGDGRAMLRRAFAAAVAHLENHPDDGRIIFGEALTNDVLRTRAVTTLPAFLSGVGRLAGMPTGEGRGGALTSTLISGALAAAFIEWLSGAAQFSRADLIDQCAEFTWRTLSA